MKAPILSVTVENTVQDAIEGFNEKKISSFLVKKDTKYVGIFTKKDVIEKVMGKLNARETQVGDVMTSPIPTLEWDTTISECCLYTGEKGIKQLGIVKEGEIVGVLSVSDYLPKELINSSRTNDELFNKILEYGKQLVKKDSD